MSHIRHKTIARLLIMLMLMTPLTGMAMQWSVQSTAMDHCHDMQMMQNGSDQVLQHDCQMNADCQKMCSSIQHCAHSPVSLLHDFNLTFHPDTNSHLLSAYQSVPYLLIQSDLFRPPRA